MVSSSDSSDDGDDEASAAMLPGELASDDDDDEASAALMLPGELAADDEDVNEDESGSDEESGSSSSASNIDVCGCPLIYEPVCCQKGGNTADYATMCDAECDGKNPDDCSAGEDPLDELPCDSKTMPFEEYKACLIAEGVHAK